jgi:succinylglutamic semialdehyde dehydrogenase
MGADVIHGAFIDGRWQAGQGAELISISPVDGEQTGQGHWASPGQVNQAVAAARRAGDAWAGLERSERIEAMLRYKAALVAGQEEFARTLSRETGKILWETRAEIASMIGKVDLSIKAYDERTGERHQDMAFGRAVLRHRPHGVMAVLGPFNFPGHLPNGHIVPALLAGDTVVFKPSEQTPISGQLLMSALESAGLPPGVANLVQGSRDVGQALIEEPIDGLLFTGSARAGAHFRRVFADRPDVILALELGGNNPLVVWDAKDPEAVAALIVQSAFITTGQRCSCARRLVLPTGTQGDAILEATVELSRRLIIGKPKDMPEPFMGSLISAQAAQDALDQVAQTPGRSLLTMEARPDLGPSFVSPGIQEVTGLSLPDEELFAPFLKVVRVTSFEEAIGEANTTRYGLSAGLISQDAALWEAFVRRIRAGVVNWNRPTTGAAGSMPFGGLGDSGNHRPSAFYAADYCAYPVSSFEAPELVSTLGDIKGLRT